MSEPRDYMFFYGSKAVGVFRTPSAYWSHQVGASYQIYCWKCNELLAQAILMNGETEHWYHDSGLCKQCQAKHPYIYHSGPDLVKRIYGELSAPLALLSAEFLYNAEYLDDKRNTTNES